MMKCKTCKHWFDNGTDFCSCDRDALLREADFFCAAWEQKPVEEVYTVREKPTNADRVRSMADEELAEIITKTCPPQCKTCFYDDEEDLPCARCWLAWLKSPAESSVFESMKRGLEQAINGETRSETLTMTKDGEI